MTSSHSSNEDVGPVESVLAPYFSRVRGHIEPGAHRLQILFTGLDPHILQQPCVLVAGSNGKGSTCAYLESLLRHHGLKTGLYTSPHLVHPNERIRIGGIPVKEDLLRRAIVQIETQKNKFLPNATFFEITTAAALLIFWWESIDFLVCEVGLGGHYDSTNALAPRVSVLTHVALEHTSLLGHTLFQIAQDKAHVSRRNRPLVIGPSVQGEALQGVFHTVQKTGAHIISSAAEVPETTLSPNLRTALCTLGALEQQGILARDPQKIRQGIDHMFWPGRFDVRQMEISAADKESSQTRTVIFDAAHNSDGARYFMSQYRSSPFAHLPFILVFASLNDKDWPQSLEALLGHASHVVVAQMDHERSQAAQDIKNTIEKDHPTMMCDLVQDLRNLKDQLALIKTPLSPIVITGSIAFLGTVMEMWGVNVFLQSS